MDRRSGDGLLTAEDLQNIEWNDGKKDKKEEGRTPSKEVAVDEAGRRKERTVALKI